MGLETTNKKMIYLNISNGKLVYKDSKGEKATADSIVGVIKKVDFADEEYQGQTFNKAKITISDGGDSDYSLQMRTDSGYFRGLCNSLKSGKPLDTVKIVPSLKEVSGKKQITCFVQQDGKWLKHFFNKDNVGDLPPLEKVSFKGKDLLDGSAQINYWKNWLSTIYNNNVSVSASMPTQIATPEVELYEPNFTEGDDEIPF